MREAYCGIRRIDALSAGTSRPHHVDAHVFRLDDDIGFARFGEDCDRHRTRVDSPLSFRCGNALYAVYAAFPSERAVYEFSGKRKRNLFIAAHFRRRRIHNFVFPAFHLRKARVHFVEVGDEQRRFVSADAVSYFDDDVFFVERIRRNKF